MADHVPAQTGSHPMHAGPIPGEATLIASWHALAQTSPGARVTRSGNAVAAVFPAWAPLNNAILRTANDPGAAAAAAFEVADVYRGAGVEAWALWVPSRATDLDAPDQVRLVGGPVRDTTTLVMVASLHDRFQSHRDVVRASIAAAAHAGEVPRADLGQPEEVPGLTGWVMLRDGVAVAGAWSFLHEEDCGVYAVGTVPRWRRHGLARALVDHVLADAYRRRARTASLQSTRMAKPLYAAFGFNVVGRYEEWAAR